MRLKLIAGNLAIVLLVGLGSYLVVRNQLRAGLIEELEDGIGDDAELFARSYRADSARLAESVGKRAQTKSVVQVFTATGESNRRKRAFDAAQDVARWFQDPARGRHERPHLVLVVDETGRVIARDTDPNRMFGEPLLGELQMLRSVLKRGSTRYGVWRFDDKLLQVGAAPVRNDDGSIVYRQSTQGAGQIDSFNICVCCTQTAPAEYRLRIEPKNPDVDFSNTRPYVLKVIGSG